jgi:hypothetical protein
MRFSSNGRRHPRVLKLKSTTANTDVDSGLVFQHVNACCRLARVIIVLH